MFKDGLWPISALCRNATFDKQAALTKFVVQQVTPLSIQIQTTAQSMYFGQCIHLNFPPTSKNFGQCIQTSLDFSMIHKYPNAMESKDAYFRIIARYSKLFTISAKMRYSRDVMDISKTMVKQFVRNPKCQIQVLIYSHVATYSYKKRTFHNLPRILVGARKVEGVRMHKSRAFKLSETVAQTSKRAICSRRRRSTHSWFRTFMLQRATRSTVAGPIPKLPSDHSHFKEQKTGRLICMEKFIARTTCSVGWGSPPIP